MRVAIYIRVSTKLQEDRFSLSAQEGELTRYAAHMGWEVVGVYKDIDSGGKLEKEGLQRLLDDVEDGGIDVVLCIDQDRLSRLDTVAWEFLKSVLRDNRVKIAQPGKIKDLEDEDDEFFSDLENLFARREKKKIVKRMMRGKRQRTREGKGWGKPPSEYNYDKATGAYSVNQQWSWVIPFIDNLYLKENLSDQAIANKLNEICSTPNGKRWSDFNVSQKLTNKAYHGVMEKTFSNGETISMPDIYPPLRSEETWEKIQAERQKRHGRRKEVFFNLLRRVNITCGSCGRVITVKQSGTDKYAIHFYLKHGRAVRTKDAEACRISINTLRVEPNLIQAIKSILSSKEAAEKYVKFEFTQQDIDDLKKDLSNCEKSLQEVKAKQDRLLDLYLDGAFKKDALDKKQKQLEVEADVYQQQKDEITLKLHTAQNNMINYRMVEEYLAGALRFEVELSPKQQMELIGTLFPSGVLFEDRLELTGKIGDVPININVPISPNPY